MISLNIQTLSLESNAAVLSIALTKFDSFKTYTYNELRENTLFVKFNIAEQVGIRSISKSTMEFWKALPKDVRKISLTPSVNDVTILQGLEQIKEFISSEEDKSCFIRGAFGQVVFMNLCNSVNFPLYLKLFETKTAITCLKENVVNGRFLNPKDYEWYKPFDPVSESIFDALDLLS